MLKKLFRKRTHALEAAAVKWQGWRIEVTDLQGMGELCDPRARLFVIEPIPTYRHAHAHARAHIRLKHHRNPGPFTDQECDDADDLARLWLDEIRADDLNELPAAEGPHREGLI